MVALGTSRHRPRRSVHLRLATAATDLNNTRPTPDPQAKHPDQEDGRHKVTAIKPCRIFELERGLASIGLPCRHWW
jgi:hypothetical protein